MTKPQGWLVITLLTILILFRAFSIIRPELAAPKWEYHVDGIADKDLGPAMKIAGQQGWELVFARRASEDYAATRFRYEMIFKRRVP